MPYLLFAGVLTGSLPDAISALVAFTALFGGAAHYGAVLLGRTEAEVERATAIGFFLGVCPAALILLGGAALELVEQPNHFDAAPGVAAATLGLTAISGGFVIGYFANRLPAFPRRS